MTRPRGGMPTPDASAPVEDPAERVEREQREFEERLFRVPQPRPRPRPRLGQAEREKRKAAAAEEDRARAEHDAWRIALGIPVKSVTVIPSPPPLVRPPAFLPKASSPAVQFLIDWFTKNPHGSVKAALRDLMRSDAELDPSTRREIYDRLERTQEQKRAAERVTKARMFLFHVDEVTNYMYERGLTVEEAKGEIAKALKLKNANSLDKAIKDARRRLRAAK